jgi:hypothetical protein
LSVGVYPPSHQMSLPILLGLFVVAKNCIFFSKKLTEAKTLSEMEGL